MSRRLDVKVAAWVGILTLFTALPSAFFLGLTTHVAPLMGQSTNDFLAFVSDNRTAMRWQLALSPAYALYIWWAAGFVEIVRVPGQSRVPARLVGWGMASVVGVTCATYVFWGVPAIRLVEDPAQAELLRTVMQMALAAYILVFFLMALVLLGCGLAIRRSAALPRWLGNSALILAVPNALIGFTGPITNGPFQPGQFWLFVPMLLFMAWVSTASVAMLRYPGTSMLDSDHDTTMSPHRVARQR